MCLYATMHCMHAALLSYIINKAKNVFPQQSCNATVHEHSQPEVYLRLTVPSLLK
jgi:hypothetical protein